MGAISQLHLLQVKNKFKMHLTQQVYWTSQLEHWQAEEFRVNLHYPVDEEEGQVHIP